MSDAMPAAHRAGSNANAVIRVLGITAAAALAAAFVLSLCGPPAPAGPGLDQSWRIALTKAATDHLLFGRDIVFTFGPLGFVLQGVPSPPLALATAYLRLALLLVAIAGAWTACSGRSSALMRIAFVGALLITAAASSIDYVAFAGGLALLARAARHPRLEPYVFAVLGLFGAFGLLSKQTLGLDVLVSAGVYAVVQAAAARGRRRRAALISLGILVPATAAPLLLEFGGSTSALFAYLRDSAEIVLGFSTAMVVPGPLAVVAGAVAIGLSIAACAVIVGREDDAPFAAAAVVSLFLAWKHGFVRQDGHVTYYFTVAVIIAALLGIAARRQRTRVWALGAVVAAYAGAAWMIATFDVNLGGVVTPEHVQAGAANLLDPVGVARRDEAVSRALLQGDVLPAADRARIGSASLDVIPAETAIVVANGLRWDPMPIFQSYAAYTPRLDALNAAMLGTHGADVELLRYEDIDYRYPLTDEPAAFAELACRYRAARWTTSTPHSGAFLVLLREPRSTACANVPLRRTDAAFNQPIAVPRPPAAHDVVRASFDIHSTAAGAVIAALWRPTVVWIDATYPDGTSKRWRIVPTTAEDGLVVSPMPRTQDEEARLFAGEPVPQAMPTSVRLIGHDQLYQLRSVTFTALVR